MKYKGEITREEKEKEKKVISRILIRRVRFSKLKDDQTIESAENNSWPRTNTDFEWQLLS